MPIERLVEEAKGLTDEALLEVIHFVQFLKVAQFQSAIIGSASYHGQDKKVYREPGLYKGQIHMSDDFDAPLEEFEEYM